MNNGNVSIEWDFSKLPCRHEEPPSQGSGVIMMTLAAFFGGTPTLILIYFLLKGKFEPDMLFLLFFTVVGTGLFLLGLDMFSMHTVTEFDGKIFRYKQTSFIISSAWDEPLTNYEGVLARSEYHRSDSNSPSCTLYIVELLHPDEQRRITLWQSRNSSSGHRVSWKTYSQQLGLPAFWQDENCQEYTQHDPKDLDKSVRELAAEGKLEITFDLKAAVPEELDLNVQGDQLEVMIDGPTVSLRAMPIVLGIIALVLWYAIRHGGNCFQFFGLFVLLMGCSTIWTSIMTPLVRIKREGIHILHRTPWGETRGNRIRADSIENVRVSKEKNMQGRPAVMVETDTGSHAIGLGLDREALEWLKNCILKKVVDG